MRNRWCDIATDVEENLLQDGGVQPSCGNANLVQSVSIAHDFAGQFNAFSSGQTATNHQANLASVAFQMHHQLAQLPHPHRTRLGFFRPQETAAQRHDVNRGHGHAPARPCFHPIPECGL